ncbi:hypothetical protein [Streptomyces sp. NPDC037389]|uniref:hypothetical protein n=1 Tax=Streptomyces sp. NPDC037389 TaxID=3155369 RepID=UPI0033DC2EB7
MHTYRFAGLAVAAVAVVAVSAPSSARAASPATPADIGILDCIAGNGSPELPDDDFGLLGNGNVLMCKGGSHDGETISLASSGGGRGDRPSPGHRPPGGHRPTPGHLPGLGDRPNNGHLPGLGERPSGGHHRY